MEIGFQRSEVGYRISDIGYRRSEDGDRRSQSGGSALIVVLWVIGLLAMLVSSFAFEARIEAQLTSYYRNRTKADYHARSGLAIAELLMSKVDSVAGAEDDPARAAEDRWYRDAKSLADGGKVVVDHDFAKEEVGEGSVRVEITPEPARLNVNALMGRNDATYDLWDGILEVGGIPEEMRTELVDSFLDWTDSDDAVFGEGAETDDYYANLEEPYKARNGPLDTVGELLLIKGFSRAILDGGVLHEGTFEDEEIRCSGIRDLLTTSGSHDKVTVNVNAAKTRVLRALPGIDSDIADLIVQERSGWTDELGVLHDESYKTSEDFFTRVPEAQGLTRSLVSTQSTIYRVTSTGEMNGVLHSLWCIVRFSGKKMEILRWREDD
jgi:general secretion pathway protein K